MARIRDAFTPKPLAATGTDGAEKCQQKRQQSGREAVHAGCDTMQPTERKRKGSEVAFSTQKENFLPVSVGETRSEGGGTRTHDQRIKSPLLYQLSYALMLFFLGKAVSFAV